MSPFPLLALASMLLDWIARWQANKPLEYLAKPLVIVFLLAWLVQRTHLAGGAVWFAIALGLSLVGDILLMLPSERFIGGLAAFFLAHIVYIVAFNLTPLGSGCARTGLAALLLRHWCLGLRPRCRPDSSPTASRACACRCSSTASHWPGCCSRRWQCLSRPAWSTPRRRSSRAWGDLFFVSDTLHGWNKFVRPLWLGRMLSPCDLPPRLSSASPPESSCTSAGPSSADEADAATAIQSGA